MSAEPVARIARCPAKVNLYLRVLGRREDGYHELDTVFQAIDLWDELELRPSARLSLACDDPRVPCDERNLVLRAARRLAQAAGVEPRGEFVLRKAIPVQGGLGGGSSDAAGALLLAARAWSLDWNRERLARVGSDIGADVPFFLVGGTARGRGRGDRIERIDPLPPTPFLLGCPPFGCPTGEVFGAVSKWLTLPGNGVSVPRRFSRKWREDKDFSLATNDLERIVFDRWPALARFRDAVLGAGARRALLSGSGSTLFAAFGDAATCAQAERQLAPQFDGWTLVRTFSVASGVVVAQTP